MGYRFGLRYIDLVIYHLDMVILDITMQYGLMIWEMTISIWSSSISIWSSSISIWDILSLCLHGRPQHDEGAVEVGLDVAAQVEFETKFRRRYITH